MKRQVHRRVSEKSVSRETNESEWFFCWFCVIINVMECTVKLEEYVKMLWEHNQKVNLISRKITRQKLDQLLNETLLLTRYISNDIVIDAGSGNGMLGVPIALMNENKKIILVEPKRKKAEFLRGVKNRMELFNLEIQGVSIEEYLKGRNNVVSKDRTLISRGFPQLNVFCGFVKRGMVAEAVLITSKNKIKKNQKYLESVAKKTYNVPLRKNLRILKILKRNDYKLRITNEEWRN
ncbi:MAG: class I SAM-dependent methyltransferase [Candidatus Aminicenantes bacterium]|nr:MAG: class I SAM-dependent methyltransferase [Candidatus Aminicenantes bacterium]